MCDVCIQDATSSARPRMTTTKTTTMSKTNEHTRPTLRQLIWCAHIFIATKINRKFGEQWTHTLRSMCAKISFKFNTRMLDALNFHYIISQLIAAIEGEFIPEMHFALSLFLSLSSPFLYLLDIHYRFSVCIDNSNKIVDRRTSI